MSQRWLAALAAVALVVTVQAQDPPDEQRSAWRYRRAITPPPSAEGVLIAVPLPADVQARSQAQLRDVRLVDATGREVPYLAHEDVARQVERRWTGQLTEAQSERREFSSWTIDFEARIGFDRLELDVPDNDFAKRFAVDLSDDGVDWREVGRDIWVFDQPWQGSRVHGTTIAIPMGEARYVRLTSEDGNSLPLTLRGVTAVRAETVAGSAWGEEVALELISTADGRARYRLPVPDAYPVQQLMLDADEGSFARTLSVIEPSRDGERTAGQGLVYRLNLPEATTPVEAREIAVNRSADGPLLVEIVNGDNPPLTNPRARVSGPRTVLVTSATAESMTLYYGNPVTRAPIYELEPFRLTLTSVPDYPLATVGAEEENPRFRQPAPLAFVATRGATIPSSEWRYSRDFTIDGKDDLYTMTLSPAGVAYLRPDLGDLRVVDATDRQVPYILEHDVSLVTVPLVVSPGSARQGRTQTSAVRLALNNAASAAPMRITGLRLQVAEPFFQRSVVVLQPRSDAPLGAVTVASTTVRSARREDESGPVWVQIPVGDIRATELTVEMADGDNAPLTILDALAEVPVPRLTFKAEPGHYRLLMGRPDARAPSYDLALLRQEVLTYAAVPIEGMDTEPAGANPDYRRGLADYLREAPSGVLLWSALGAAVLVLLFLIRRILRHSSPRA